MIVTTLNFSSFTVNNFCIFDFDIKHINSFKYSSIKSNSMILSFSPFKNNFSLLYDNDLIVILYMSAFSM